ncbi:MAG: DUF1501 domain-containing protein [Armatimonadaceae bacterium]
MSNPFGSMIHGTPAMALASLFMRDAGLKSQKPTRVKRVLQIVCPGAASHIDLWDYKPELFKRSGEEMPGLTGVKTFQGGNGRIMRPPWEFRPAGRSGKMLSSMLPNLARHADDMAFIHSMTARSSTHGPGLLQLNTGFVLDGFPSMGAWLSMAMGNLTDNLPTYVSIPDVRGLPPNGPANWGSGFLPAAFQGTAFNAEKPLSNMGSGRVSASDARLRRELERLDQHFNASLGGDSDITARMKSYALAAKMQLAAPEATDLRKETPATHALYGTTSSNPLEAAYARNALLSRRLLERGVRFVQLYCGACASGVDGLLNWDAHKTLKADYERHVPILDRPTAGLLADMKSRGLLDDTLILWTTEFGRMPTHQIGAAGRDHNPDAFTVWMMGAGVKGGTSYGATDEFGHKSVTDVATVYDFHATVLALCGIDHTKLTYYHNGAQRRLTDVHGHVIRQVMQS